MKPPGSEPTAEQAEMPWQSFVLQPFDPEAGLALTGRIRRGREILELHLHLSGDLASVVVPEPSPRPERRDDLWRSTCFELFLGAEAEPVYREVNLAPSGHWNVYRFSGYRRGMEPEPSLQDMPFGFRRKPAALELALAWMLPDDLQAAGSALEAGVCAVIERRQGRLSHWAVNHPGDQADFHRRDGLVLRL
ncbi:DOMON-like domain-containing protein [Synechococcus sp. CS-205]|uniref:DOMON-like domain-containing protein n=1 Tax=Synechococcus sp. CS-205 TaxID=2847984 RepID=UPI00223B04EA|nr:DOMON-like domain-containing protein [Synechococcus sp. CS-205]MCT0248453.1 DOMON-like domain-containing protein [Synechococcus sp. CS-205]